MSQQPAAEREHTADDLRAATSGLQQDLRGLHQQLGEFVRHNLLAIAALEDELAERVLTAKIDQQRWVWWAGALVIGSMLLSDLARGRGDHLMWGLVFWTTQHGADSSWGPAVRGLGLSWQVGLLTVLRKRATAVPTRRDR